MLSGFQREVRYWTRADPLSDLYRTILPKMSFTNGNRAEAGETTMLRRNPLLCGLLLLRIRLQNQNCGLTLANAWGTILEVAHIYVAARHYDTVSQIPVPALHDWPEMDMILHLHGKDDIFAGKVPSDIDESSDAFMNMMGMLADKRRMLQLVNTTDHFRRTWLVELKGTTSTSP